VAGIYIHIPFCRQACHYCDFHFSTNLTNKANLVSALCIELEKQQSFLNDEEIQTIYFGGGSPSLLSYSELESILSKVYNTYNIISSPEITLEGNPDDLTFEYLATIARMGINRLSIGIQSFNDSNLKFLNRVHNSSQSTACLENASKAGFSNYSLDLIYGIPSSTHKVWEEDIIKTLDFHPKHISAYCLTIEEKTAFGNWLKKGKLRPIDEEYAAAQYEIMIQVLGNRGYEHYEISNFSLPGYNSKHNSSYWKRGKYLGVGPGAHSYNGEVRRYNVENNAKYIHSLNQGVLPFEEEVLSLQDKINEYLLTTIRTSWGCDLRYILREFNYDLRKEKTAQIEMLINQKVIFVNDEILFLSEKGKLLADEITENLMVEYTKR
jgi:oxygen-independent coproporphyrinogen III oxidase